MSLMHRLYGAIATRTRPQRMRALAEQLGITPVTHVLDVGGSWYNWQFSPVLPQLTILNLEPRHADCPKSINWIQGDALRLPFNDLSYDVAVSNSVIEHVGEWDAQRRFADEVRRVAYSYWVQTPNYRFPIEPHFLGLGVQYLPRRIARHYVRYATGWGLISRPSVALVEKTLDEIHLLTVDDVQALFPDCCILPEQMAGLTKSLIAIRHRPKSGGAHTPSSLRYGT